MVEALVAVVLEQLVSVFQQEVDQEVRLVVNVRKEVTNLTTTLTIIKAVLEDAEEKQMKNEAVKIWLGELKDIVYDAEDVLDEWSTKISVSQIKGVTAEGSGIISITKKRRYYLFSPCSCFNLVALRHDIGYKIKGIRERLDVIAQAKNQFNLVEVRNHEDHPRQVTSSIVDAAEIRGRDIDKEIILRELLAESNELEIMQIPIISVVGMGGVGKTTLAQIVHKEESVLTAFELRIWVCVSERFDLERIAKEIIEQATGENTHNLVGWEALHQQLCGSVKGKRFLLVLDDVWSQDYNDWSPLKLSLLYGARRSRILVTTRNERVATMLGSAYTHRLGQLSDDDCWSLFRYIALWGRSQEELEKFEEIGKEIAMNCKGVPLAAKTLASLMRFKQTKQEWRNVLPSDIWKVQDVEKGLLPTLLLSYNALSSSLKQCFMYCAIFPKDEVIEKDRLVKLWMAQGFLGSDGGQELEVVGGEHFDDLAMRSFFQDFVKDDDGKILSCKMHGLVHDFLHFLAGAECSVLGRMDTRFRINKVRHINACSLENLSVFKAKNLRTLIFRPSRSALSKLLLQLTCLRALDLSGSDLEELPNELEELFHLRYLDFSKTKLKELPETMCNLYNLQTLKLNYCDKLHKLPRGIGKLLNLRHIELEDTCELSHLPVGIGKLSHLRTLCKFIMGNASGGCTIPELGSLNHLKGNLEIIGLRQVKNVNEAKQAELLNKKNLSSLKFDFEYFWQADDGREDGMERMSGVLEGLQPHNDLESLQIDRYPGLVFPSWMSSESLLPNVVTLELHRCRLCTGLPALGKLRSLESLSIEHLVSVKQIGHEFYGVGVDSSEDISFPKLKKLTFRYMEEWEVWEIPFSKFKKIMPRLCDLTLWSSPRLIGLPALGRLESLETIRLRGLSLVKHVGLKFLGIDDSGKSVAEQIVFPSLKKLRFEDMLEWEEWKLPLLYDDKVIMPHLHDLEITYCTNLKELPALGRLQSLKTLALQSLDAIKCVTVDLLGISCAVGELAREETQIIFPQLMKLKIWGMKEWEWWNLPFFHQTNTIEIMPHLHELDIGGCPMLRALPALGELQSLERLKLANLPTLKHLSAELLRIDGVGNGESALISSVVLFPALTELTLATMPQWEEDSEELGITCATSIIMPRLHMVNIYECENLKVLPRYIFSHSLRELEIELCPQLTENQPCLSPLLEYVTFVGDVGILSRSILPVTQNNSYPNLKFVTVRFSPHSSLPQGLNQLTSLQHLWILNCQFPLFNPEELRDISMLQELEICECPIVTERCREDWSNLSHIAHIIIDSQKITERI